MAYPILVGEPQVEPLTLAEARRHLRLDADMTSEDPDIEEAIRAAREMAEAELRRRLITQTWDVVADGFPSSSEAFRLHGDVWQPQAIVAVYYIDSNGATQEFGAANYVLDAQSWPGYVVLADGASWPSDVSSSINSVKVRVRCGYGDAASDVPASIRRWIRYQVGTHYGQRETMITGTIAASIPDAMLDRLLDSHRVVSR